MIGRARTHGAISIINALFEEVGAAVGVELPVDAEVEIDSAPSGAELLIVEPAASRTPVVEQSVDFARRELGWGKGRRIGLRIRSEIPPGVGLKSSSAVTTATLLAISRAAGIEPEPEATARHAARVARNSGLSATGAFDDALASVAPGIWVTDNRTDRVLRGFEPPRANVAVIWIPPGIHPPSSTLRALFRSGGPVGSLGLAMAGELWPALERNSSRVEELLGYSMPIRGDLRTLGATAIGVTGLGPAWVVVAPPVRAPAIAARLRNLPGLVRTVRFTGLPEGGAT